MSEFRARIGQSGRLVIPAGYRKALGFKIGDEVILRLAEDELRVLGVDQAVRKAQATVRRHAKGKGRLSDFLLRERRAEAEHG